MNEIKLDIKEILKALPHRYPFLLVDKIIELEEAKRCVGIKNVTINEPYFQGHFPDYPVMPGVLIAECMAQVGAIMAMRLPESKGKLIYYAGIDKMRFRRPVIPGDQLRIEVAVLWVRGLTGKLKCTAAVDGNLAAEGEILFSLVDRETKGVKADPNAIIHPTAKLGEGVEVGPFTIIGPDVVVGARTRIGTHTVIEKNTTIGDDCHIYHNCAIATPPQDYKYKGEKSRIVIGARNIIREFVTIHLPTGEGEETRIGNDNFLMMHSHVAHNCKVGNHVVLGGFVGLGGHSTIDDFTIVGGMSGIHQYCRVGKLVMVGAHSKIVQDIPPFMLADGHPAEVRRVNSIGLERRGISTQVQTEIKKAFKILYQSKLNTSQAIHEIKKKLKSLPEINALVAFLEESTARGIRRKAVEKEIVKEEMILPEIPEIGI